MDMDIRRPAVLFKENVQKLYLMSPSLAFPEIVSKAGPGTGTSSHGSQTAVPSDWTETGLHTRPSQKLAH